MINTNLFVLFLDVISEISRGILPIDYLSSDLNDNEWYENIEVSLTKRLVNGNKMDRVPIRLVGGFSLLYGHLQLNENNTINKLNIISNRGDKETVFDDPNNSHKSKGSNESTIGLSNSLFYDPWNKVEMGKHLLSDTIKASVTQGYDQQQLVEELFKILSKETFDESLNDAPMFEKIRGLKDTIFVPPLDTKLEVHNETIGKYYGTRTQTIILLDKQGNLHYYEKDLNGSNDSLVSIPNRQYFTFNIDNNHSLE